MKTHFLKAAALVILIAFFANAATLEAEMAYYLESNETYAIENITANGATYSLIKIGGAPSLVLNASNEVTAASETINAVAEAYTQAQMDTLRQTTGFRSLQTDFSPVYDEFLLCEESSRPVLEPVMMDYYKLVYGGNDPLLRPAYDDAERTTPILLSNFNELNNSIVSAQTLSGRPLYDELGLMVTKVSAINSLITTYASATSYLRTYFADDFSIPAKGIFRYICQLNSTSLNAFSSDLGIRTSIPIASDIAVQITNATNTRTPKANQRKIVAVLAVDYNAEVQKATDAKSRFPLGDSILSQRQNDLATSFQRLNATNATGTNSTNDLIAAFNYSKNRLEQAIAKYEQVYPNYLEANTSVLATEQAMQVARERFGRNDERISSLQTQVNTLSNEFNAAEEALRTATANSSQFQSIQVRALNLTGQITAVQPKESTIDYATIAVIAVIVIGFAALIVYAIKFRKRPPQAASQPSAPASSGEEAEYR
ncbi:hypothetical protein H0O03_00410 [Candidatus Micrarchaeota archaeon]|nr:hypothetical protein [Candidatus Micrarchaeota archaeon]